MYKLIKDASNESTNKSNNKIQIKNEDATNLANEKEMANFCNKYYINVGLNLSKKILVPEVSFKVNYNNNKSMYLTPVDENELTKYISTLKNNGSPGPDGITAITIKNVHKHILKPLVFIINNIFKKGTIPEYFKSSIVTPIHKSGNASDVANFRPISLINNFAKLLEKVLKDRLYNFLDSNGLLAETQFGFVRGVGTTDALHRLVSEVTNSINRGKKSIAIFLDLARAFDTVPHGALLDTLSRYGVRGAVLSVFESYLANRPQVVRINGTISEKLHIGMGVPQGTVLGPLLFITYINPLLKEINIDGSIISYADDTALVFSDGTWEGVKNKAEKGMKIVKRWFDSFLLSLNLKKTNYIAFSLTAKSRPTFNTLKLSESSEDVIKGVTHTKYLGVLIDQYLKWDRQIEKIVKVIKGLIHKFYMLREILNKNLLVTIYKALVESVIRYGIVVWGGLYKTSLYPLNIVQNSILKIIYKKTRLYHTSLLYSESVLDARCLYILCVSKFMARVNDKKYISHKYQTRQKNLENLMLPVSMNTMNLKSIAYMGPKIFNCIPTNIRKLNFRCKNFNKKCAEYIFRNYDSVFAVLF